MAQPHNIKEWLDFLRGAGDLAAAFGTLVQATNSIVTQFRENRKNSLITVAILALLFVLVYWGAESIFGNTVQYRIILAVLVVGTLLTLALIFFKRIRKVFQNIFPQIESPSLTLSSDLEEKSSSQNLEVDDPDPPPLKILTIGLGASGKSCLSKRLRGLAITGVKPTTNLEINRGFIQPDEEAESKIPIAVVDYAGQRLSQAVYDALGGDSDVNIIMFVVDIIDSTDKKGRDLENEEIIEFLKSDPLDKINDRVRAHIDHFNSKVLEIIFDGSIRRAKDNSLIGIVLVINKMDIFEEIVNRGHLELNGKSNNDYIKELFDELKSNIEGAFRAKEFLKLEVFIVSLRKSYIDELKQYLVNSYSKISRS